MAIVVLFIHAFDFVAQIINCLKIILQKNQVTLFSNLNFFNVQYFLVEIEFFPSLLNFHSKFAAAISLPTNPCLSHLLLNSMIILKNLSYFKEDSN